jgi:hypothetical protein
MAEKKQRRERLSARDHQRAIDITNSIDILIGVLEQMYPTDLELKIARPAMQRFRRSASVSELLKAAGAYETDSGVVG